MYPLKKALPAGGAFCFFRNTFVKPSGRTAFCIFVPSDFSELFA
jgi:hypothetical protein